MNVLYLSSFFLVGFVCADPRILFAEFNGTLDAFSSLVTPKTNYLTLHDEYFPDIPIFDFNLATGLVTMSDGIFTQGTGNVNGDKVFGIYRNKYIVFGKNVEPIKVKLNHDSKVMNLHPYLCIWEDNGPRGFLMTKSPRIPRAKCHVVNLYFKHPGEVEMGMEKGGTSKMPNGLESDNLKNEIVSIKAENVTVSIKAENVTESNKPENKPESKKPGNGRVQKTPNNLKEPEKGIDEKQSSNSVSFFSHLMAGLAQDYKPSPYRYLMETSSGTT